MAVSGWCVWVSQFYWGVSKLGNSGRDLLSLSELGESRMRHMAVGQRKVFAQRTYGVTNGAADRSSPDSSGSPQLANGSIS
ncbi:MAG: hypothetical protein RIS47_2324 [Bacteroidota bacterium]